MNYNYAAVLLEDGKLHLHLIDQNSAADKGGGTKSSAVKIFPDKEGGNDMRITCVAITNDFLVYGTSDGLIHHSTLGDWVVINSNKHKFGIKSISLNYKGGTKFIFQDDKGDGYLCNPSTEMTIKIGSISAKTIGALWNYSSQQQQQTSAHRSIFVSWDANLITTTYFQQYSTRGPQLNTLGVTRLPYGLQPVLIVDGIATVQVKID